MPDSDYTPVSRFLHRIALGMPLVTQASFDIEQMLNRAPAPDDGRHVFVAGLARAGTTILLRALHDTGTFRSLTYRDMPFVLMPNLWAKLSRRSRQYGQEQERAHGDRIGVNFDSPEAFEEVFWRTFCGKDYIGARFLQPHSPDPETVRQFVAYVGAVVASGETGERRYLSKNNNNVLRLPTIAEAFPDATILMPFRDPIQQANSLLRQHRLFCERHREDPFARDYMHWLGHHEFGLTHRAFRFVDNEAIANGDPNDINYWLHIWHDTYAYLLRTRPANAHFVCYEQLCREPVRLMEKLMCTVGVEGPARAYADAFVGAEHRSVPNVAAEIAQATAAIYSELTQIAAGRLD